MTKHVIRLDKVWKIYKLGETEVPAVKGIDVEIKEGEFVSIIGKSGSGKSTCLNMVGCLDVATKGNIYLDGKNIAHLDEAELARVRGRKIGFVFQTFNLIPSLNAVENVRLPMIFQGLDDEKMERRAKKLLEMVDLGHRFDHKPNSLSGGERQRVAIARSLANDPEVILADEPTGNLDTNTGEQILKLLVELNKKKGKTLIIVTHDMYVARKADRIIRLKDGLIVGEKEFKND